MARPVSMVELDATQRRELQRIVSASTSTVREVRRARIILLRAEGKAQAEVAEAVQVNRPLQRLQPPPANHNLGPGPGKAQGQISPPPS